MPFSICVGIPVLICPPNFQSISAAVFEESSSDKQKTGFNKVLFYAIPWKVKRLIIGIYADTMSNNKIFALAIVYDSFPMPSILKFQFKSTS